MRDPIRSALRADTKAWSVGLVLIVLYLFLNGDEAITKTVEETYLDTSPVSVSDHGLHQVSQ